MKKPLFNQVAIVGVGLIGGSVGMAVKKRGVAKTVVGIVRKLSTGREAIGRRAIDAATRDLKEGVRGADLIVLASPVSAIEQQLRSIAGAVSPRAVIIDVGSTKTRICKAGKRHLGKRFVGCHPMAGLEKTGVEYADPRLFDGSVCFMTAPHPGVKAFWKALGASTIVTTPERHDAWVAQASHMPHLLSFALFQKFASSACKSPNPSIRDLARLSKSDPELWADIFLSNRKSVTSALKHVQADLSGWRSALQKGDRAHITRYIREANRRSHAAFSDE